MKAPVQKVERISVIDSHTAGEPTRTVILGGPELGSGTIAQRQQRFSKEFDHYRSAVINEPRGNDVLVGALICKPTDAKCAAAAIFFNNVGFLGMCGHGAIGVAVTLAYLGRVDPGHHLLETPVGIVGFELDEDMRQVTIENVPSFRYRQNVSVEVSGYGNVVGDIAWGGNWFFLAKEDSAKIRPQNIDELLTYTRAIRKSLEDQKITGHAGQVIDHIEIFSDSSNSDGKNFVLCPGGQWDRSPCGTGTSAKVACLAADGKLAPDKVWRQESVIGTDFEARYRAATEAEVKSLGNVGIDRNQKLSEWVANSSGVIVPSITGSASITSESQLLLDPDDPFRYGIPV